MRLGVIGGSGLYQLDGLEGAWQKVHTPWGTPSDELLLGRVGGVEVAFLPRHGRGHRLAPHEINYRANIAALKIAGCTEVLAVSACGSFREELPPGTFVAVDQFVDHTRQRERSFFGDGVVAHVGFGEPTCARLRTVVADALQAVGVPHRLGGTYAIIEGPRFSTRAESEAFRAAGADVIGMTGLPEGSLAREAELCLAAVAMVTDFDAWHPEVAAVDVAQVIEVLHANAAGARRLVAEVARRLPAQREACEAGCDRALDGAVITERAAWPTATVEKLQPIAGRVLG